MDLEVPKNGIYKFLIATFEIVISLGEQLESMGRYDVGVNGSIVNGNDLVNIMWCLSIFFFLTRITMLTHLESGLHYPLHHDM
jgi:hypothetical protein